MAVLTDVAATPVPSDFDFEVFPVAHGWEIADAVRVAKVTHRWRPDLVHVQYPTQGYGRSYLPSLLPAMFRVMNLPIVQTWHEYDTKGSKRQLLNAALGGGLIAVRPDYKANMPDWFKWLNKRKRFVFIPNASAIPRVHLIESERIAIRSRLTSSCANLVVYFGFAYPAKGVEFLFEVADPRQHCLVLIGDLSAENDYHKEILKLVSNGRWAGKVMITGFLPADEVGRILAAADAVVLPFRKGGGMWNTSIHAAMLQGTFVLTTAQERHGYDSMHNVYYARPDDVADMRHALQTHIGSRKEAGNEHAACEWEAIAEAHREFYSSVFSKIAG